jgi:regulatory protein
MLAARARSATELRRLLVRKGEPAVHVDAAIQRLQSQGYLDDAEFARQFARSKVMGAGHARFRLRQELARRGVARDIADAAIDEVLTDESVDESAIVSELARKKLRSLASADAPTRRRRLYGFLSRRGYDPDAIRRALDEVLDASTQDDANV